ncbi:M16 family metallopeptidase [Flavobacterium sp. '19STA2R22 D10 B1']|uniref:M16 family metallopeptidase n=1 Tax=Flavobacterium aerium TaxID=3037261 RepID=UPI00278C132B|nr:insulinase family protein [Flavobacterium sp. '19STA2R22 D10 B1']
MKQLNVLLFLLMTVPGFIFAQEFKSDSPIPFDATVKKGKLKNGLTYYIKKNSKPENKVDLRLVVNAGSILEDDDQRGLAHFMEHMCFNGTKRFPKNQLVDYLQSIGVKFGQHLNAYTSFDETAYFLPIPSDDPEKLEKGFQIIEDWAFNTVLTPEEIDKERGVVLEEYRLGLGADKRMLGKYISKMLYKSHYADRLPIGKKEILEKFKHEALIRFYKDWYRPNLMSVIVVGDIDPVAMEKKIIEHFSGYKNPKNERPRKTYDVPNHKETFVAVESDKEASFTRVNLVYKDYDAPKTTVTVNDYRNDLLKGLFSSMLNNRLDELVNTANPPFNYAYAYYGSTWARTKDAYQASAMTQEDKSLQGLKVVVEENERVRKFGFTQNELERAKAEYLASYEKTYNDRDKTNSVNFVGEYQGNFLKNEPVPGIAWEYETIKNLFPTIKVEEVNKLITNYIKEDNRVVVITGPEKEGLKKVTEKEVLEVLKVNSAALTAYQDSEMVQSLLRKEVKPGKVIKKETNDKIGTTTLTLSNGAKVVYKKTDFKNDEVLMDAVSFGGTNLYSNEEMNKTQWANNGLTEAGVSGLKINDINKFMTGKIAKASPYISAITEGVRGSSTPKDLEYLFQMTHAYFTDLNQDDEAFAGYKQKQTAVFKNLLSTPSYYFQDQFYRYIYAENPRFTGIFPDEKALEVADYDLAYKKYKERFANAGDFVFYFVGNIDDAAMEKYSEQYLASLPSTMEREKMIDLGYRYIKGDHKKVVNKGTDPKSSVTIMYQGDCKYDPKEDMAMQALGEVLSIKLVEELRENESGVYGVGARGSLNKVPYGSYSFSISFPCGPENAEKLTASALRELQKIVDNGPDQKDVVKYKEGEILDYKKDLKENRFWLGSLKSAYVDGTDVNDVVGYEQKVNAVTAKEIQAVAKKYLTKDKIIGMLMPEMN